MTESEESHYVQYDEKVTNEVIASNDSNREIRDESSDKLETASVCTSDVLSEDVFGLVTTVDDAICGDNNENKDSIDNVNEETFNVQSTRDALIREVLPETTHGEVNDDKTVAVLSNQHVPAEEIIGKAHEDNTESREAKNIVSEDADDVLTKVVRKQEAALRRLENLHGPGYGKPVPGSKVHR